MLSGIAAAVQGISQDTTQEVTEDLRLPAKRTWAERLAALQAQQQRVQPNRDR